MLGIGVNNRIDILKSIYESNDVIPSNITTPVLTGTIGRGNLLICPSGTWNGSIPMYFGYFWYRNEIYTTLQGNTYMQLTSDTGKSIKCKVEASNGAGIVSVFSNTIIVT